MPWMKVFSTVRRSKAKPKKTNKTKSLQQLPQNFSFLERPLRHPVFYTQRFPSAGSASPFCPPPALRAPAGPGGGPGRARAGPAEPSLLSRPGPNPGAVRRWLPPGPRRRPRFLPSSAAPGLPPTPPGAFLRGCDPLAASQPPVGSGGVAASRSPPGRALRREEVPRTAPPFPPGLFPPRPRSPPTPPQGRMDAPAPSACVRRGAYHYLRVGGRGKGGRTVPSLQGGVGVTFRRLMAGWGRGGREENGSAASSSKANGKDREKGKEKKKGARYGQAQRRRQPERRPECGGRYRRPPPPFFPQG